MGTLHENAFSWFACFDVSSATVSLSSYIKYYMRYEHAQSSADTSLAYLHVH
jgi:hypothetical protein